MNRAKEIAAIMATYEPGQVWQHRTKSCENWYTLASEPKWSWDVSEYRRKPEPKLRPWRPEEVPVGALIRNKIGTYRAVISESNGHRIEAGVDRAWMFCRSQDMDDLMNQEHSTDGGKTWHPCGVMVTE